MLQALPSAVTQLRDWLVALRYDDLQRELRRDYLITPFPAYKEWKATTQELPEAQRVAYDFLLFNEPLDRKIAASCWGEEIVEALLATRLARTGAEDRLLPNDYSVVSYDGHFFAVSLHASYPAATRFDSPVYCGPDSYGLIRALPRRDAVGTVLELCSGPGFCSILLAGRAERVIGVELNADAVEAARFNAALNGVAERVEFRHGSLYEPVANEQFDLIIANPPFLPVPADVSYTLAMCGNGGEDGFSVLGGLLDGIQTHLAPGGRALVYAEGLGVGDGTRDEAFIADRLRALAATGLDVTLRLLGRMPIKQLIRLKSISLGRQGAEATADLPRWRALYESSGATHSYNFVIHIEHGSGTFTSAFERRRAGDAPHFAAGTGAYVVAS